MSNVIIMDRITTPVLYIPFKIYARWENYGSDGRKLKNFKALPL
jgi:hypothetical protein